MPPSPLPRTLIVGGGIGGLTAAAALSRLGADVRVVEQAPVFEPVGAGITIQANGNAVLQALGIELPTEDAVPIGAVEVVEQRGRVLISVDPDAVLPDPPSVNIHRADLHRALLAACADVSLETGRAVVGVRPEAEAVAVEFADGAEERAELVIGVDGIHSAVRRSLVAGADVPLRYSGQTCWRFALTAPDLVPRVSVERWGPGRRAGVVPLSRGRIYVYLVANAPQGTPGPGTASPESVRARFGGIDAGLDAALERLDDEVAINHSDLCDRPGAHYGAGRVVLLGDAAHAMTPNAGQGAGTAIEDAGLLALLVGERDPAPEQLASALALRRRQRVVSLQTFAWRAGKAGHWRNPLLRFLRDIAARSLPASAIDRQARSLWAPGLEIAAQIRDSGRFR